MNKQQADQLKGQFLNEVDELLKLLTGPDGLVHRLPGQNQTKVRNQIWNHIQRVQKLLASAYNMADSWYDPADRAKSMIRERAEKLITLQTSVQKHYPIYTIRGAQFRLLSGRTKSLLSLG